MILNPIQGLYVITDRALVTDLLVAVEQALCAGARIIQYRDKQSGWKIRLQQADAIKTLCRRHQAYIIINDDIDLALAIGADGVHLGEADAEIAEAKARLGDQVLIGYSCYNQLTRALRAQQQGADYVAFGRFFPSYSKPNARLATIDLIKHARPQLQIPIVAIGGITSLNAAPLIEAGVDALAVIHDVLAAKDIYAACLNYKDLFADRYKKESSHDAFTNFI